MYGTVYQLGLYDWFVPVSADTTNNFKTRLDKHWHKQDIIYDSTAQLHGTGTEVVVNRWIKNFILYCKLWRTSSTNRNSRSLLPRAIRSKTLLFAMPLELTLQCICFPQRAGMRRGLQMNIEQRNSGRS